MAEHDPTCPRAQAWDHGEHEAPCTCRYPDPAAGTRGEWTPEPWKIMEQNIRPIDYAGITFWEVPIQCADKNGQNGGNVIATVHMGGPGATGSDREGVEANARRIVACVNACRGLRNPERDVAEAFRLLESYSRYDTCNGARYPDGCGRCHYCAARDLLARFEGKAP